MWYNRFMSDNLAGAAIEYAIKAFIVGALIVGALIGAAVALLIVFLV
jgi:hypothetical protein